MCRDSRKEKNRSEGPSESKNVRKEMRGWILGHSACLPLGVKKGKRVYRRHTEKTQQDKLVNEQYWLRQLRDKGGPKLTKPSKRQGVQRDQSIW